MTVGKWWRCKECKLAFLGEFYKRAHIQEHIRRLDLECYKLTAELNKKNERIRRWRDRL